ncbi:surface-adhesin E family protein [Pseudorhodoferax sp.]|uniref:surface-adhesin E family protein n=1 Tax=Pseudorhodoferax sp. TaxID=1993553 RepID=UPI002DD69B61|nr:surface-adhesin E family protein [Pseudorhodoferax sp.]
MRPVPVFLLLSSLCCGTAVAGADWFTVTGDPQDEQVDTVQVDPRTHGSGGTLQMRISRTQPRISWDGVPYRSYTAQVAFDCVAKRAQYHSISFHLEPLWRGDPHRTVDYRTGEPRMMEFREMRPNPTARIIAAACNTGAHRPAAPS